MPVTSFHAAGGRRLVKGALAGVMGATVWEQGRSWQSGAVLLPGGGVGALAPLSWVASGLGRHDGSVELKHSGSTHAGACRGRGEEG